MKNLMALIILFFVSSSYANSTYKPPRKKRVATQLDYLVGDWVSSGFTTTTDGEQQLLTLNQHITHVNSNDIEIVGAGSNPTNGFPYTTTKTIFYDNGSATWFVKGNVNNKYTLNNKVDITTVNTITYTFYDGSKNLMRYTITKESDDAFTEVEEIWTKNGWDKTAWLRSKRIPKSYSHFASITQRKSYDNIPRSYSAVEIIADRPVH